MNYKQYLKSSAAAKVSLILLIIDVIAAIYITSQAARFTGAARRADRRGNHNGCKRACVAVPL